MIPTTTIAALEELSSCAACDAKMIAACNAHAFEALKWGLIIGTLIGSLFFYVGSWYRGRK